MIVHIYFQIHDMALTLCIFKFAFLSYSIPICRIFHLLATFIHRYINTIKQSFNKSKLSKHYIQIYRKFRPKTILSYLYLVCLAFAEMIGLFLHFDSQLTDLKCDHPIEIIFKFYFVKNIISQCEHFSFYMDSFGLLRADCLTSTSNRR